MRPPYIQSPDGAYELFQRLHHTTMEMYKHWKSTNPLADCDIPNIEDGTGKEVPKLSVQLYPMRGAASLNGSLPYEAPIMVSQVYQWTHLLQDAPGQSLFLLQ